MNNEAEYKALLYGLELALKLGVKKGFLGFGVSFEACERRL